MSEPAVLQLIPDSGIHRLGPRPVADDAAKRLAGRGPVPLDRHGLPVPIAAWVVSSETGSVATFEVNLSCPARLEPSLAMHSRNGADIDLAAILDPAGASKRAAAKAVRAEAANKPPAATALPPFLIRPLTFLDLAEIERRDRVVRDVRLLIDLGRAGTTCVISVPEMCAFPGFRSDEGLRAHGRRYRLLRHPSVGVGKGYQSGVIPSEFRLVPSPTIYRAGRSTLGLFGERPGQFALPPVRPEEFAAEPGPYPVDGPDGIHDFVRSAVPPGPDDKSDGVCSFFETDEYRLLLRREFGRVPGRHPLRFSSVDLLTIYLRTIIDAAHHQLNRPADSSDFRVAVVGRVSLTLRGGRGAWHRAAVRHAAAAAAELARPRLGLRNRPIAVDAGFDAADCAEAFLALHGAGQADGVLDLGASRTDVRRPQANGGTAANVEQSVAAGGERLRADLGLQVLKVFQAQTNVEITADEAEVASYVAGGARRGPVVRVVGDAALSAAAAALTRDEPAGLRLEGVFARSNGRVRLGEDVRAWFEGLRSVASPPGPALASLVLDRSGGFSVLSLPPGSDAFPRITPVLAPANGLGALSADEVDRVLNGGFRTSVEALFDGIDPPPAGLFVAGRLAGSPAVRRLLEKVAARRGVALRWPATVDPTLADLAGEAGDAALILKLVTVRGLAELTALDGRAVERSDGAADDAACAERRRWRKATREPACGRTLPPGVRERYWSGTKAARHHCEELRAKGLTDEEIAAFPTFLVCLDAAAAGVLACQDALLFPRTCGADTAVDPSWRQLYAAALLGLASARRDPVEGDPERDLLKVAIGPGPDDWSLLDFVGRASEAVVPAGIKKDTVQALRRHHPLRPLWEYSR